MYKIAKFVSAKVRGLPIFNPFENCGEYIEIPFTECHIPTFIVEFFYPIIMTLITLFMVAIVFGYQKGSDPLAGCGLFFLTYCINSLVLKWVVGLCPNGWLIALVLIIYFKLCGWVSNRCNGLDYSYEQRMMSSGPPHRPATLKTRDAAIAEMNAKANKKR